MKLVRYGRAGSEKPGLIDAEGRLRDLSKVVSDITPAILGNARQLYLPEVVVYYMNTRLEWGYASAISVVLMCQM